MKSLNNAEMGLVSSALVGATLALGSANYLAARNSAIEKLARGVDYCVANETSSSENARVDYCVANETLSSENARAVLIDKERKLKDIYNQYDEKALATINKGIVDTKNRVYVNITPLAGHLSGVKIIQTLTPVVINKYSADISGDQVIKNTNGKNTCFGVDYDFVYNMVADGGQMHYPKGLLENSVILATDERGRFAGLSMLATSLIALLGMKYKKMRK